MRSSMIEFYMSGGGEIVAIPASCAKCKQNRREATNGTAFAIKRADCLSGTLSDERVERAGAVALQIQSDVNEAESLQVSGNLLN